MRYCIEYTDDFHYFQEVDELKIRIRKRTKTSPRDFIERYANKRIIIEIEKVNENLIKDLCSIKKDFLDTDIVLAISEEDMEYFSLFKEEGFSVCPRNYISNWDTLQYFLSFDVSDLYIAGTLCFELDKVKSTVCQKNKDIKIRVFPNLAQAHAEIDDLKKFFIRPEDISYYEPYVDVYEFIDQPGLNVIYRVYAINHRWIGDLNEIILGISKEINNQCVLSQFGEIRRRCGKRCFKGHPCSVCEKIIRTAELLEQLEIAVTPQATIDDL